MHLGLYVGMYVSLSLSLYMYTERSGEMDKHSIEKALVVLRVSDMVTICTSIKIHPSLKQCRTTRLYLFPPSKQTVVLHRDRLASSNRLSHVFLET